MTSTKSEPKTSDKRPIVHWTAAIKFRHHSLRWKIVFVLVVLYILMILIGLGE